VPLGLSGVSDVHQGWNVILAGRVSCFLVGPKQGGIIPGRNLVDVISAVTLLSRAGDSLKTLQDRIDIFFHHLKLVGYRDAIAIIVDTDNCRGMENANGIDRFPEVTFSG